MWKTALNTGLKEVRFVLKRSPEHHGAWKFVQNRLSELRMLNTNVFFSLEQIPDDLKSNSACHIIYGDRENTEHEIVTTGLSYEDFETTFIDKVKFGNELIGDSWKAKDNTERELPVDVVEAHKHVHHLDDGF